MAEPGRNWARTAFLLAGSFCFSFLLAEMIHELGHFLAHQFIGSRQVQIHLDPFGGSRIMGVPDLPWRAMGITSAAGPALNLAAGLASCLLLGRSAVLAYFPLALWGPVALIQEGVNLSLGLLIPNSDARWIAAWGAPPVLLAALGAALVLAGTWLISSMLAGSGLLRGRSYWARFGLVFLGLSFLMLLRAAVSAFQSPAAALENLIPLVFALILALAIAGLAGRQGEPRGAVSPDPVIPGWGASLTAAGLGAGILLAQVVLP